MAEQETGMIFTQSGVPVDNAADYQKVLDSRWRFMEVELDQRVVFSLPSRSSVTFANRYYEKTTVLKHNLGFIPLFETDLDDPAVTDGIWADKKRIYVRRLISTGGASAVNRVSCRIRVYNVPVLEDYEAPKDFALGSSSPKSDIGVQFLEDSGGVDLGDRSPIGFSVDTRKKILSIHRHGLALINDYSGRLASGTAVDTTNDIITVGAYTGAPYGEDYSWVSRPGQALLVSPDDFTTWPGGLSPDTIYYVIPVDATHIKLATTYENALAGTAINITSTGTLPLILAAEANPSLEENAIYHGVGYPPTFLLTSTNWIDVYPGGLESELNAGPIIQGVGRQTADTRYLRFFGVQSPIVEHYGYVILKDPLEVAG